MFHYKATVLSKKIDYPPEFNKLIIGPQQCNLRKELKLVISVPKPKTNLYTMSDLDYDYEKTMKLSLPIRLTPHSVTPWPKRYFTYNILRCKRKIEDLPKRYHSRCHYENMFETFIYYTIRPPNRTQLIIQFVHEIPTFIITSDLTPDANEYYWRRFFTEMKSTNLAEGVRVKVNDAEQKAKLNRINDWRIFGEEHNWSKDEFATETPSTSNPFDEPFVIGKDVILNIPPCITWDQYFTLVQAAFYLTSIDKNENINFYSGNRFQHA